MNWVLVFEAPIDLMSYLTLHRKVTSNAIALCGLYEGALDTYLRDNPITPTSGGSPCAWMRTVLGRLRQRGSRPNMREWAIPLRSRGRPVGRTGMSTCSSVAR